MSGVLHMRRPRAEGEGLDLRESLCGIVAVEVTEDPGLVRCKLCRRRMDVPEVSAPAVDEVPVEATFVPGPPVPLQEVRGTHAIDPRHQRIIDRSLGGEDIADRPRWSSLEKALAKTSEIKRAESSMRSGWRDEFLPGGSVRTLDGREDVLEVDMAIERAWTSPGYIGHAPMTAAGMTRALLLVLREGIDAKTLADELSEAHGFPVTEQEVKNWIGESKSRIRTRLEGKGIIEKAKPREASQATKASHYDLEGWKAIAAYVGRSDTRCRAYYALLEVDPLPFTMHLGRACAMKVDLDAWLLRRGDAHSAA